MPLLASLMVGIAGQFATFLATYIGKKTAMGMAAALTLSTIIVALLVGMRACLSGIAGATGAVGGALGHRFLMGLGMFIPPHAGQVIGCILATWSACVLYKWQAKGLDLFVKS